MDIWSTDRLVLFIAFVIPGFVSLKTYELLFPAHFRESSKLVIDAVAYSCINYALLLWPIYEIETHSVKASHPLLYILFYVFVVLIAPVLWAGVFAVLRHTRLLQKVVPHPIGRPWDYVFKQCKRYWVIVTLKDGTKIAGKYDVNSFTSSAPAPEQIYLEEAWVFADDGFDRARTDTAGVLILSPDIVSVELVHIKE